ncbi:MAG: radical SAM protein [Halanaerobiales bacterium]|nr:radical SAM protein [Halanaerobiales bacterium]
MVEIKKSNYNIFHRTENNEWLAYNLISDGLAVISPEQYLIIQNILKNPNIANSEKEKQLKEGLIKGRFLIEDYVDELKLLRTQYYQRKYKSTSHHLTIFTTFKCNFDCPYCYQKQLKESLDYSVEGDLQEDVANGIIEYLRKAVYNAQSLHVDWFGGEPLLKTDLIMKMSMEIKELCEDNSCDYEAGLITNGYLLTPAIAEKMKRAGVKGVLITLDGPPEIHNKSRPLKNGEGTFYTILKNIRNAIEYFDNINIRINIDQNNIEYLDSFLDILEKNDLNNEKIHLIAAPMEAYSESLQSCKVNSTEFTEEIKKLTQRALKKGFNLVKPKVKSISCYAQEKNTYSIAPDGSVYKCPSLAGNPEIRDGYIDLEEEDIKLTYNVVEWMDWNPFDKEDCLNCKYLPYCLGGCPYNDVIQRIYTTNTNPAPQRIILEDCKKRVENKLKSYLLYDYMVKIEDRECAVNE